MAERRTGVSRDESQAAKTLISNIGLNSDAASISKLSVSQLENVARGTAKLTSSQHEALASVRQNQQQIRQLYDHNLDRPRGERASKPGQAIRLWLDFGKTKDGKKKTSDQIAAIKALGALGRDPGQRAFYVRRGRPGPAGT